MDENNNEATATPQNEALSPAQFQKNVMQVIVHWPLYRKYEFTGDLRKQKPHFNPPVYELELPKAIQMDCLRCVHKQPWDIKLPSDGKADLGFVEVRYACRACGCKRDYWLVLNFNASGGSIIKTGQHPPLELEPPPLVAAGMGIR
jgi:hypothetical protein